VFAGAGTVASQASTVLRTNYQGTAPATTASRAVSGEIDIGAYEIPWTSAWCEDARFDLHQGHTQD